MSCQAQCGLAGSKRGKNAREQVTIFFFGFNFHWLRQRSARSFSKSQSEQNKTITFETHLKIAIKIENTFLRSIILIGLKKEARGLSANHKQRKIRLLVSKLIANHCKLKTNLREKCLPEN